MGRVVVVDDNPDMRKRRVAWLRSTGHEVVADVDFEQALACGDWRNVTHLVLDCYDGRSRSARHAAADRAGVNPLPSYDRAPAIRVITTARSRPGGDCLAIVVVSTVAHEDPWLQAALHDATADVVAAHDLCTNAEELAQHLEDATVARDPSRHPGWLASAMHTVEQRGLGPYFLDGRSTHPQEQRRLLERTVSELDATRPNLRWRGKTGYRWWSDVFFHVTGKALFHRHGEDKGRPRVLRPGELPDDAIDRRGAD